MTTVLIRWAEEEWFYIGAQDGMAIWGERDNAALLQPDDAKDAMRLIDRLYGDQADVITETP